MMMKIYAVFDAQVSAFLQPFFSPALGSALRSLSEVVNDPAHTFAKHANDYSLYYLGDFDDSTGIITTVEPQRSVSLIELIKKID